MTGLLVALGLLGQTKVAADVAIVQGAAAALFFSFSGNARSLIFKSENPAIVRSFFLARVILIIPLSAIVFVLGSLLGGVAWPLCVVLILRKSAEWLGELHLSYAERGEKKGLPSVHLALQCCCLLAAVASAAFEPSLFLVALTAWAVLPFAPSFLFLGRLLFVEDRTPLSNALLLPHFGSSAVAGIGVYVFRLILLALVGREISGTLFTAFAIGGLFCSVFVFGFGPGMILAEQRSGRNAMGRHVHLFLGFLFFVGLAVSLVSHAIPSGSDLAGQSLLFWQTMGFSLLGSVVMVYAQMQRLRDLQHGSKEDVFAPDVLVEMTSVIFVPTIFFMFGVYGMSWLSLFYAIVALVFYAMMDVKRASSIIPANCQNALRWGISILLILPLFVSLESGIFRSQAMIFESYGSLAKLPIPVSVAACYLGIALLGNYRRANLGLAMVFGVFVTMVLTTVHSTGGSNSMEQAKLFLLLQHILPSFAIALGMMIENHDDDGFVVEKATLCVIAFIVPVQLAATWIQHSVILTPYLYLFSTYQHLQYGAVMFVAGYVFALFSLWQLFYWRWLLLILTPLLAIYASASCSLLAAGLGCVGSVLFLLFRRRANGDRCETSGAWAVPAVFIVTFYIYTFQPFQVNETIPVESRSSNVQTVTPDFSILGGKVNSSGFVNATERLPIWNHYLSRIRDEPTILLFGNSRPPLRDEFPSAHNYYLYLVYMFGLGPFLVLGAAIAYTVAQIIRNRDRILQSQSTVGLCLVVLFLLFADNMLKEGLRMPYAGILTFYLWGLLLSRLQWLSSEKMPASNECV